MSSLKDERLESKARRAAKREGLRAAKSRRAESADNLGQFMLIDLGTNSIVAGERYDMTAEEVVSYCTKQNE